MKRSIIFLDIDGVLDSRNWFSSPIRKLRKNYRTEMATYISPRNLFWVSLYCRLTRSKVVLSSSWRYGWNDDGTVDTTQVGRSVVPTDNLLRKHHCDIISVTPSVSDLKNNYDINWNIVPQSLLEYYVPDLGTTEISKEKFLKYSRGAQILTWLEQNNYTGKYLIFEDDWHDVACFNCLKDKVIRTSFYGYLAGFGFKHFIKAIRAYLKQR